MFPIDIPEEENILMCLSFGFFKTSKLTFGMKQDSSYLHNDLQKPLKKLSLPSLGENTHSEYLFQVL